MDIQEKSNVNVVDDIKEKLKKFIGSKVTINYNLGRNKFEQYDVIVKKLYDSVFIVEFEVNTNIETKSFSYADIITKTIKIDYK